MVPPTPDAVNAIRATFRRSASLRSPAPPGSLALGPRSRTARRERGVAPEVEATVYQDMFVVPCTFSNV